ncbi:uncharacterized protein [Physcomitrium patens]|uniref:uncharacterized protein isoform X2 n=1 Tax=Physcomitrium patens TaxID=3218 RepID=UPI003CCD16D9
MEKRTTAVKVLLGLLCLHLCSSSVAAEDQNEYNTTDLYAMEQLWGEWNKTNPDFDTNLAGWNDHAAMQPPCKPSSPWRGVSCNAKQISMSDGNAWKFEIVGLALRNAEIVGSLPPAIGNLTNLVTLTLTENRGLTGAIPEELGNLKSLFELDLHGNGFTGYIPRFFYDAFGFLQAIDLSDNQLKGQLPENNNFSFRTIQTMNVSKNLFSGDLSHNEFTGALPTLVSPNQTKILELDFSDNKLNGSFPTMSGLKTIRTFNASGNLLSGKLDTALLFNISSLTKLDLSRNRFTGAIPNLTSLTKLEYLDLSYNNFTPGPVPDWIGKLKSLHTLKLQGVSLTGDVPWSVLAGSESLTTLLLDFNDLKGTLDISRILAAPNLSRKIQIISLRNNSISHVAYSGHINDLNVKFNLSGNPYCDLAVNQDDDDLTRCVCQQTCFYTGNIKNNKNVIIIATVVSGFVTVFVSLVSIALFCQSRRERKKLICEANQKFADYEVKPTIYTYSEIRASTGDFHPEMRLGSGHYGAVYKGTFPNGTQVAVKQLFTKSQQTLHDFLNEIVLVAAVKHRNLVKLKGCCIGKHEYLLVHEYVELGDLEQLLFENSHNVNMCWAVRRNICLGVGHGIHYLHSLTQPRIIHRDIKASNILLDKNLEPKIADFGLALLFPVEQSNVLTIHIAGTRGYLAPEYATLGQLSEKVDVYSFGVLILEIVSGRRNIDSKLPEDRVYLLEWAWKLRDGNRLLQLLDPKLTLQVHEEVEVLRILNIAFLCLHISAEKRPTMARVVAMMQGDMDAEISELTQLREESRLDKRFESIVPDFSTLPHNFPSSSSIISLPSSSTILSRDSTMYTNSTPSASSNSVLLGATRSTIDIPGAEKTT